MVRAVWSGARFFWRAAKGHRLRPWRSEYLRWRVETYSGRPAGSLRLRDFMGLFLAEPRQMMRFFDWSGRMRRIAAGTKD